MSGSLKLQPCIHFSTSLLLIVNGTLSSEHCLYTLLQSTESPMDVRNSIARCTRWELGIERKQRIFHCMCHVQRSLWTRLYTIQDSIWLLIQPVRALNKHAGYITDIFNDRLSIRCNAIYLAQFFCFCFCSFLRFLFLCFYIFDSFRYFSFFHVFRLIFIFPTFYRNMWSKLKHFDRFFSFWTFFFTEFNPFTEKNDELNIS